MKYIELHSLTQYIRNFFIPIIISSNLFVT